MCDYSLMSFPNRLAVMGEELVVHRFPSGSMGLTAPADVHPAILPGAAPRRSFWTTVRSWFLLEQSCAVPAVCIPPQSRLVVRDMPEALRAKYGAEPEEEVVFTQLSAQVNTYRDAVRLRNGRAISLQELREGQRVIVLDTGNVMAGEGDLCEEAVVALETPEIRGR